MFLRMGLLLRLGPNVITDGPVITLVPSTWYPDQWVSPYFIRNMRAEPRD